MTSQNRIGRPSFAEQLGLTVTVTDRMDGRVDVVVTDDAGTVLMEGESANRGAATSKVYAWITKAYPDFDFQRSAPRRPREPKPQRPSVTGDASTAVVAAELSRRADRCDRLAAVKRESIEKITKDLIAEAEHLEREAMGFRQAASLLAEVE